jgi:hypothetical protein
VFLTNKGSAKKATTLSQIDNSCNFPVWCTKLVLFWFVVFILVDSRSKMEGLPAEIWVKIFGLLSPGQLARLCLVCTSWNQFINDPFLVCSHRTKSFPFPFLFMPIDPVMAGLSLTWVVVVMIVA